MEEGGTNAETATGHSLDENHDHDEEEDIEDEGGAVELPDGPITQHWKKSRWAVGKVNIHWADEVPARQKKRKRTLDNNNINANAHNAEEEEEDKDDGSTTDAPPAPSWSCTNLHLKISGLVCSRMLFGKTERVGNMTILWQRPASGTNDDGNATDDEPPKILLAAGPLWFVTVFVTVPLIVGISTVLYTMYLQNLEGVWIPILWATTLTVCLICLAKTSLSNPGIFPRHPTPLADDWIWNDQTLTFRPPTTKYDPVCACMVEGFDHVCPWVGTAVGAGNMMYFKLFVAMVTICLFQNIVLVMVGPQFL